MTDYLSDRFAESGRLLWCTVGIMLGGRRVTGKRIHMKRTRINPETLFYIVSITGIVIMFGMLAISNGKAMYAMGYGESLACDFWAHIKRLMQYDSLYGNLNDADAIFPPLAYCFLSLFAQCLRHFDNSVDIARTGYGVLVFNMYLIIFVAAFIMVLNDYYESKNKVFHVILPFIFLFSYPFWGCAFERGNPVIYAMLFLFIGLMSRNHTNRVIREMAMIFVAIAAGFKLYPALFGLIWIRERKCKEALRLLIYGIIAFFAPFIFFGGIHGINDYVGTFIRYTSKDMYSKTSILGNCIMLFGEQGKNIGKVIVVCWVIWVVLYIFSTGGDMESDCFADQHTYNYSC